MSENVLQAAEVKRQTNGQVGQLRTVEALSRHLWVMQLNADIDSGDLLVADPRSSKAEERRRRTGSSVSVQGVIQCKFFEEGNAVYIDNEYVEENGSARQGFFLHIHTDDKEFNAVSYFLFPEDIYALPSDEKGERRRFSITKEDDKRELRVVSYRAVIEKIKFHLGSLEQTEVYRRNLAHLLRAKSNLDTEVEYHLLKFKMDSTQTFPESKEFRVIIARTNGIARSLDARGDLQLGGDTFSWGYYGGGPKLTVLTILAHHLGGLSPTRAQIVAFRCYIAGLNPDTSHIVPGGDVDACVSIEEALEG